MNTPFSFRELIAWVAVLTVGFTLVSGVGHAQQQKVAIEVNDQVAYQSEIESRIDRTVQQMNARRGNQQKGNDVDPQLRKRVKEQVVDQTVDQLVLLSHAQQSDVSVDDQQLEERFQSTKERFPSEEAFNNALEQQGMSEDELREQLRQGLLVEQYLNQELDVSEVSEQEVREYYENNKQRFKNRDFETIKGSLERIVRQQKRREARQELVSQLREESDINVRI
jgi:hypothetical protein